MTKFRSLKTAGLLILVALILITNINAVSGAFQLNGKPAYSTSLNSENPFFHFSGDLTYTDSLQALDYAYSGYEFSVQQNSGVFEQYDYATKTWQDDKYSVTGFALLAAYQATGDTKYLDAVRQAADHLSSILPSTGLVPALTGAGQGKIAADATTYLGGEGQLQAVQAVAYLAREDKKYLPLLYQLTNALIKYGINPENNLTWYQVNTLTGKAAYTTGTNYETQLGQNCSNVAESLLAAYEADPSQEIYKQKALDILKGIWECRNTANNLLPEVWDVALNQPGKNLYPESDFRYDDMGGAYIRALTMAYQITKDSAIRGILQTYSTSLVNAIWDDSFNGGGFRYLTHLNGTPAAETVETMYGLFIGTLLEAEQALGQPDGLLYQKSLEDANHIFLSGFGLKNDMVPHQLNGKTGGYMADNSDSELNYAAIQFLFGMGLLSQESGNPSYRQTSERMVQAFLDRAKVGDNQSSPQGYADITETQPPYGLELSYGIPKYMMQIFYLPTYSLFSSIHPGSGVSINWQNGLPLGVFGLATNMPFLDRSLVSMDVKDRSLSLNSVTGAGSIDLADLGFGSIKKVMVDNHDYSAYSAATLTTLSGTHSYKIFWN